MLRRVSSSFAAAAMAARCSAEVEGKGNLEAGATMSCLAKV